MLIAILCDAGPDLDKTDRKVTILIDQEGHRHETRVGWPDPGDVSICWGPILMITPKEYLTECQIACGEA
jgi:hypothetical protein